MYNILQKKQLANLLRKRYLDGEAEGYQVVVALMALVKDGKIEESDIQPILLEVHGNNKEGVVRSLQRALSLVDGDMLNSILNEVKKF